MEHRSCSKMSKRSGSVDKTSEGSRNDKIKRGYLRSFNKLDKVAHYEFLRSTLITGKSIKQMVNPPAVQYIVPKLKLNTVVKNADTQITGKEPQSNTDSRARSTEPIYLTQGITKDQLNQLHSKISTVREQFSDKEVINTETDEGHNCTSQSNIIYTFDWHLTI